MTVPAGVMLPSELERRQIFHSLKRWSSYTAWNRILGFYQAWADAAETSLREASAKGLEDKTSLPEADYVLILKGVALFDEGVRRLREGDKRVFRCKVDGRFVMAAHRAFDHWWQKYGYVQSGDIGVKIDTTPNWPQFVAALTQLEAAWSECSAAIIEAHDMRGPTGVVRLPYGVWLQEQLGRMSFPDPLPEVPDPKEVALVRTGKDVPCSGIWEPVVIPERKVVSLFKTATPQGPFPPMGCMSYLHGGSSAPKAAVETVKDNLDISTTWRLLWRDDRHLDGIIPAEESAYSFLQPEFPVNLRPVEHEPPSITVVESGQPAPVSGRWLLQESLRVSIDLGAGRQLPLHEGRSVRWVLAQG
jgi:hypothetical protein